MHRYGFGGLGPEAAAGHGRLGEPGILSVLSVGLIDEYYSLVTRPNLYVLD